MEDEKILELYFSRDEGAIAQTQAKYGAFLSRIAYGVLGDLRDCQECVNDTYLKAWNSIPPHRPRALAAYLGKITRQGAIDAFRARQAQKRGGSEYELSLSELGECVSGGDTTAQSVDVQLLAQAIEGYLRGQSHQARNVFLARHYYLEPVKDIAARFAISESKVKSMLHRTRQGLRRYLEKEGFQP